MFLYGGNDGNNTLVPFDPAGYAQYASVRAASSGIQLAQASLLPIQPAGLGTPFGLHPSLPELQALFNQRRLAVLANVAALTLYLMCVAASYELQRRDVRAEGAIPFAVPGGPAIPMLAAGVIVWLLTSATRREFGVEALVLAVEDDTFKTGSLGLWVQGDTRAQFDDLLLQP